MWSETGTLQPGITFHASQAIPADPMGRNFIQLTADSYGATYFTPPTTTGPVGSLTIEQLATVVPNRTACGISMSGAATYVVQAAPNMTAVFTPHPNYWIAFGNYMPGQVLDIETIRGEVEAIYAGSITSRTATLQLNNILTIA